jgi:hypothetical protein
MYLELGRTEMTGLFQDVRYALRQLRKSPGFTTVAVLTLGLGIGLNSAIFTLFDALTLRPLPISDPDAVVNVYQRIVLPSPLIASTIWISAPKEPAKHRGE